METVLKHSLWKEWFFGNWGNAEEHAVRGRLFFQSILYPPLIMGPKVINDFCPNLKYNFKQF